MTESVGCGHCDCTGVYYINETVTPDYRCSWCNGTGIIEVCDKCGMEFDGEYCSECYEPCGDCGVVGPKSEYRSGICNECFDKE